MNLPKFASWFWSSSSSAYKSVISASKSPIICSVFSLNSVSEVMSSSEQTSTVALTMSAAYVSQRGSSFSIAVLNVFSLSMNSEQVYVLNIFQNFISNLDEFSIMSLIVADTSSRAEYIASISFNSSSFSDIALFSALIWAESDSVVVLANVDFDMLVFVPLDWLEDVVDVESSIVVWSEDTFSVNAVSDFVSGCIVVWSMDTSLVVLDGVNGFLEVWRMVTSSVVAVDGCLEIWSVDKSSVVLDDVVVIDVNITVDWDAFEVWRIVTSSVVSVDGWLEVWSVDKKSSVVLDGGSCEVWRMVTSSVVAVDGCLGVWSVDKSSVVLDGGVVTDVNITVDCAACEVWFDLGDVTTPGDSFVICVESKILLADIVLEAKDVFIVAFDVVSITIGCIVIIWTVVLGIVEDGGVNIRVFSVVETSVDVALENSVESNEVKSILGVKMSPNVEDFTRSVVLLFVTRAGSKVEVTEEIITVSVDLSELVVMNEDADDSWCWRILVDTIVASVEFFEMSMVVDEDVNDGVYWVIEDANGDWLPEFDCAFINVVETDITIGLVVIKLDGSCEKLVVENETFVCIEEVKLSVEISAVVISMVAVTVFLVYCMTVVSVDVDVVPVCNGGFIDAKSEE